MTSLAVPSPIVKPLVTWLEARGYTVDATTGKATRVPAPAPLDYFQERAIRKARQAARAIEAQKALKLYSIDHAAARRGEREFPQLVNYTAWTWVDGPRELVATDYAKSRFNELPSKRTSKRAKAAS